MLKLVLVWAFAGLFTVNALLITIRANWNAGTLLMWIISAALIFYGIFHKQVDALTRQGFGRALKFLFLFGVLVYAGLFVFVAVSGYTDGAKGDENALIVLGAGVHGERVSNVLARRLQAALGAWQASPDAYIVVTGGQGPGEDIPEALAMQRWLEARGVPAEKIIMEDKSTSTEENLAFAKRLLAEKGVDDAQPVAVVTNAFHCYRAGQYAEKLGFSDVRTVPATMTPISILPSYLREVLAILYLWVFRRGPIEV